MTPETNEATPILNKEYSYDEMGNRVAVTSQGERTDYSINALNQITQLVNNGEVTVITYGTNGNMTAVGNKQHGMDLIQERGADGSVKASYLRDGNIGGVLSMTNADGTFFYHYDGNGNVVALNDENQEIVAAYNYDAFGNLLSSTGTQAEKNPFRFSTKYYDGDTGLYDFGFRHYDPMLGRWITHDPIGEMGGLNLYDMVGNNPVNDVDDYGLSGAGGTYGGNFELGWPTINVPSINTPIGTTPAFTIPEVSAAGQINIGGGLFIGPGGLLSVKGLKSIIWWALNQ